MRVVRTIIILLLIFSRQNSTAQFVKLFSDSLKTLKPTLALGNIIEKNGSFYMANQSSDGVGTIQTLAKFDTAGRTIWTTHPLNYIDAGVFNQNRAFQKIVFGIEGSNIYSLLDGARIGKIRENNGSMDWISSVTNIFGSSRVNFIDYDSVSVIYANAAASFNTVRLCRVSKSNGQNIGYVDLPCNQPAGFGIYIINKNIYLASLDTCYKYTSFDDPTLLWKTRISNSFGFSDIGSFDQSGNDLLIFGSRNSTFSNGRIACVDKQTGTFKWLTELGGSYSVYHVDHKIKNGSLYTAWEHVYVGSIDERCLINKINLSTGAMIWQFNHAFRTQYVVSLPTEAMVSFDIDDNEMIYMTGYGLPDNYNVQSWGFMKIRGSDGTVLKRNYIPDLSPLNDGYPHAFFIKLVNNKPYSFGFRASNLAKALLDTANLTVIQNQPMVTKIQFPSALVGMTSFSDTKKILLKKVGKGLKIEMVDASYNRIWERLLSDTINFYKGYDLLFVNDSTKKIYVVARGFAYASANNFFFYYTPNSADGHTVYEFDSLGNNTNSYYEDDSPNYITPVGFFLDSVKRTFVVQIRSTFLSPQSIPLSSVGLYGHYWTPRSYPLYKPKFFFYYSKDTVYSFGGSGTGNWGPARFVKEWPPYFNPQSRTYPILYSLYLMNSVERESKSKYYIVGKDSTWKDMLLKYSTSDSSVVWYKKFDSSIITYKCFYQNSAIYAVSSQNKNILLRKFNSDDGSLIWTIAIPVPVNNYLKLMDFDMSKQRGKITIAGNLVDTVANRDMSRIFAITIDTSGAVVNQFIKDGYRSWTNQGASVFVANDGQTLIGGQISDSVYGFAGFIYAMDTTSTSSGGVAPSQPGTINGSNSVCQNSSQTYSVNAVAGATSYTWTLPGGWTGTSSGNTINITVGATGGTISVTANNIYGTSPSQATSITVNPVPTQPGAITGSASPCINSSQTYSVTAVAGATSYTWTLPSGWSGTSTTNSISVTVGSSGGTISVKANNGCGSGTVQSLSVNTSQLPAQPGVITGNVSPCSNSSQTYSITSVAGATSYTWTLPPGWSGTATTNSISVTVGNTAGSISVKANNNCGSSASQSLSVTPGPVPAQPGTISGSTLVTSGQTTNYSIIAIPNTTGYTWSLSGGGTITAGQNTNAISITWSTQGSYNLSVKALNNCSNSDSTSVTITVSTTTAVVNPDNRFLLKVMPNPTSDVFYVSAKGVINKNITIEVMNTVGQNIYSTQVQARVNDFSHRINLGKAASGIYRVKIIIGTDVYVRNIMKQ